MDRNWLLRCLGESNGKSSPLWNDTSCGLVFVCFQGHRTTLSVFSVASARNPHKNGIHPYSSALVLIDLLIFVSSQLWNITVEPWWPWLARDAWLSHLTEGSVFKRKLWIWTSRKYFVWPIEFIWEWLVLPRTSKHCTKLSIDFGAELSDCFV